MLQTGAVLGRLIDSPSGSLGILRFLSFEFPTSNGASLASLPLHRVCRNAIVDTYTLNLVAGGNVFASVANVGQVRKTVLPADNSNQSKIAVVVDFGSLVTVDRAALRLGSAYRIYSVTPWSGNRFDKNQPAFNPKSDLNQARSEVTFDSEVRTERLRIELVADASAVRELNDAKLYEDLLVHFPGAPADLELRLNDGPPIWTLRGPVPLAGRPGESQTSEWNQKVPVAAAVNALIGKPDDSSELDLKFTLHAKQPGFLKLDSPASNLKVKYIQRVHDLGPNDALELQYQSEGWGRLSLVLPGNATQLDEVRFTLVGNLPPERVLPATGPGTDDKIAKLVLDGAHAAAAQIPLQTASDLSELTAVRLPLHAEAGGAEVRAQLWRGLNGEPNAPFEGGVSKPVVLTGQKDDDHTYGLVTFEFAKPVPLPRIESPSDGKKPPLPYVALLVSRGRVWWSFADMLPGQPKIALRVGPPTGPWRELPGQFAAAASLGGRLRAVGHAHHDAPLPPIELGLSTKTNADSIVAQEEEWRSIATATPTTKGVPVVLKSKLRLDAEKDKRVELLILSHVGGAITVKDLQVIFQTELDARPDGNTKRG